MADANLLLSPEHGRLEVDLEVEAQVVAGDGASGAPAPSPSHSASHPPPAAEEGVKDVPQVDLLAEAAGPAEGTAGLPLAGGAGPDAGLPVHVVLLLKVRVVENLVRAVNLLELLGGINAWVGVRMVLFRHLAVARLDLLGIGPLLEAEDLVEVPVLRAPSRHREGGRRDRGAGAGAGCPSPPPDEVCGRPRRRGVVEAVGGERGRRGRRREQDEGRQGRRSGRGGGEVARHSTLGGGLGGRRNRGGDAEDGRNIICYTVVGRRSKVAGTMEPNRKPGEKRVRMHTTHHHHIM